MAGITETANGEKSQIDFKEITSFIVEELSKRNLLRKGATTYQNTESLLYKYNDLKKSVEDREEEIEEIKTTGLRGKSKSIFKIPEGSHSDYDTIEEDIINGLISDIKKTQLIINRIDRILKKFKSDKYIDIIKLKYFENKMQQDIADYFEKDTTTIWRNNKRLINEIKVYLFPNDVIKELNYWQNAITHAITPQLT